MQGIFWNSSQNLPKSFPKLITELNAASPQRCLLRTVKTGNSSNVTHDKLLWSMLHCTYEGTIWKGRVITFFLFLGNTSVFC